MKRISDKAISLIRHNCNFFNFDIVFFLIWCFNAVVIELGPFKKGRKISKLWIFDHIAENEALLQGILHQRGTARFLSTIVGVACKKSLRTSVLRVYNWLPFIFLLLLCHRVVHFIHQIFRWNRDSNSRSSIYQQNGTKMTAAKAHQKSQFFGHEFEPLGFHLQATYIKDLFILVLTQKQKLKTFSIP